MTVNQLLANIDATELIEWQAFFSLEHKATKEPDQSDPRVVEANLKLALEQAQQNVKPNR